MIERFHRILDIRFFLLAFFLTAPGHPVLSAVWALPGGDKPWSAEFKPSYGFVIRHHTDMGYYTTEHFGVTEVTVAFRATGDQPWQHRLNFPASGFSYQYSSLGNTAILGDVHCLYYWKRFLLFGKQDHRLNLRIGFGAGYFRKTFDRTGNYKNLAIGSHINGNMQLLLEYRYCLSERMDASLGLALTHFSNGSMVTPNYGINIPHLGVAVAWKQGDWERQAPVPEAGPGPRWKCHAGFYAGIKEIMPAMGPAYRVYALSLEALRQFPASGLWGGGIDLFWDGSEREVLRRSGEKEVADAGLLKTGIKLKKEWAMGRLSLDFDLGFYLYQLEKSDGGIYDRIGLKYRIWNGMFLTSCLKTHYARADYIGWGLGWTFEPVGK